MAAYGLIAITVAWVIQLMFTTSKKRDLNPLFLIFSSLGGIILAVDAYQHGSGIIALLNSAIFVLTLAIFLKTSK